MTIFCPYSEPLFLEKSGLSIGDTIRLDTGTGDFEDALARREFTIVGTADSPLYISVERGSSSLGTGAVSAFVLLPQAAFSLGYYTDAYLQAEGIILFMAAFGSSLWEASSISKVRGYSNFLPLTASRKVFASASASASVRA